MAIRMFSATAGARTDITRTTLALPTALLHRIDEEIAHGAGGYISRAQFVRHACEIRLWQLHEEEIDRQILAAADDPEWAAIEDEIMKEFEAADAETARMITEEFGPWEDSAP